MTAPVTPEVLNELERLDAVATIDWQPGVYWPYDDTADIAYGCKLRNAAPALIAAARERDALAAENARLRHALDCIVNVANAPIREQDPWQVIGHMGSMAETALVPSGPSQAESSATLRAAARALVDVLPKEVADRPKPWSRELRAILALLGTP